MILICASDKLTSGLFPCVFASFRSGKTVEHEAKTFVKPFDPSCPYHPKPQELSFLKLEGKCMAVLDVNLTTTWIY